MIDDTLARNEMIRVHPRGEHTSYGGRRDPWLIVRRVATMQEAEALEATTPNGHSIGVPPHPDSPSPRLFDWSVVVPMWCASDHPGATEVAWIRPAFWI